MTHHLDLSTVLAQHEIAEAGHRILNPIDIDKLMLLGEVCRLGPGQRQLDLACGKGVFLLVCGVGLVF